jgi:hypothetical protein
MKLRERILIGGLVLTTSITCWLMLLTARLQKEVTFLRTSQQQQHQSALKLRSACLKLAAASATPDEKMRLVLSVLENSETPEVILATDAFPRSLNRVDLPVKQ